MRKIAAKQALKYFFLFFISFVFAPLSIAANFPESNKPIRIIVPYTGGGSSDFIARVLAKKMSENMAHPVIVENKPGAGTIIAADYVAQSKPDGYTLMLLGELTHSALPATHKTLPFDPLESFTPITNMVESPLVLVVHPSMPVDSLTEFIEYAKEKPGELSYGSAGLGNTLHIAGEVFQTETGVELLHIPYKGASQAVVDLLADRIDLMFDLPQTPMNHIKEGKLKALAITSAERLDELSDVPTTTEAEVPEFTFTTVIGLAAPAGVPDDIVEVIFNEVHKALEDPEVQKNVNSMSMFVKTSESPEAFKESIANRINEVGAILEKAGVEPQ